MPGQLRVSRAHRLHQPPVFEPVRGDGPVRAQRVLPRAGSRAGVHVSARLYRRSARALRQT